MRRIFGVLAGIALLAMSALAQDAPKVEQMKLELERVLVHSKMMSAGGGVMGRSVKGAPYSGQEITESTQVLGDGTRIRNESRAMVYRDSEGRVRRETGDFVTIWDPVANENYTLDTKNMTASKSPMMGAVFTRPLVMTASPGATATMSPAPGFPGPTVSVKDGTVTIVHDGKTETLPVGPDGSWSSPDGRYKGYTNRVSATGAPGGRGSFAEWSHLAEARAISMPPTDAAVMADKLKMESLEAGRVQGYAAAMRRESANLKTEELGEQTLEGVKARGTRQTSTIEAGVIGNDRPINTMSERWVSDELQTEVMTRRSDPRTGEQTFRLANINRGEQAAYLFQAPSGYTMKDLRK